MVFEVARKVLNIGRRSEVLSQVKALARVIKHETFERPVELVDVLIRVSYEVKRALYDRFKV